MPRRTRSAAAAAIMILSAALGAAEIKLSIRFFDKRIFYPESQMDVMVTLSNEGDSTYRFKLADDRVYSLSFEARTPSNRLLDPSDVYRLARSETRPVFYRELAIKPGEEYSFRERLERFVRIEGPGSYSVRASFHPELAGSSAGETLVSNALLLSIRPSALLPPASETVRATTGETLKALALPPDEVVRRTIEARQKGRWNEFFLYLDLESLLTRDEDAKRAYDAGSDQARRAMLERFRTDLQASVVEGGIVVQPYFFEIIETRYTSSRGFVKVLEKFQSEQLRFVKEYTYELARRDSVWYIVGYSVLNKGTE